MPREQIDSSIVSNTVKNEGSEMTLLVRAGVE